MDYIALIDKVDTKKCYSNADVSAAIQLMLTLADQLMLMLHFYD